MRTTLPRAEITASLDTGRIDFAFGFLPMVKERLTTEHFMALPGIVHATDLAVVMPRNVARGFAASGGCAIVEPEFALRDFTVSLHWSRRFEGESGNQWLGT